MNDFDLSQINLNLVPALSALLREASVSRAARRVGVSQSAMSHSLSRLRELFDDPLLVLVGRAMVLTPRAEQLAAQLPDALEHLQRALRGPATFEPGTADLVFRIATVDYFELTSLPYLIEHLARVAPRVRLAVQRLSATSADALARGEIDLVLATAGFTRRAGVRGAELYRDPFKVIARAGHPGIGRKLSLDAYLRHDHVLVQLEPGVTGAVDRVLARSGHTRRVGLFVPHFVSAPLAVAASNMLSTLASSVAQRAKALVDIRIYDPPIEIPAAPIAMYWPRAHEVDPARTWFRELIGSGVAFPRAIRRLMREA